MPLQLYLVQRSFYVPVVNVHAIDGLADQTPLHQVLKYEAGHTIV